MFISARFNITKIPTSNSVIFITTPPTIGDTLITGVGNLGGCSKPGVVLRKSSSKTDFSMEGPGGDGITNVIGTGYIEIFVTLFIE